MVRMTHNEDADTVYISLREGMHIVHTQNLDGSRLVDYAEDREPVGIELLDVSDGVNLDGLPRRDVIELLLVERHIPVFA